MDRATKYQKLADYAWHLTHVATVAETLDTHRLAGLAHIKAKKAAGEAFCSFAQMGTDSFKAGQEKVTTHMTQASRHTKRLREMGAK